MTSDWLVDVVASQWPSRDRSDWPNTNPFKNSRAVDRMSARVYTIIDGYHSLQVIVRLLGGSSEGEGSTPLPLRTPPNRVYNIDGSHQGVVLRVR